MTFYQIGWFSSICHLHQWRIKHGCYGCFSTHNIGTIYYCHRPLAPAILGQKPRFLIKSGYYIVPSSTTALSKGVFHVKYVENYFVTCQISSLISIFTSNSLKGSIAAKSAILLSNRMWLWKLIWLYMILVGLSSAANVHFATRIRYHSYITLETKPCGLKFYNLRCLFLDL